MTFLTVLFLLWHNKLFDKNPIFLHVIMPNFRKPGTLPIQIFLGSPSGEIHECYWFFSAWSTRFNWMVILCDIPYTCQTKHYCCRYAYGCMPGDRSISAVMLIMGKMQEGDDKVEKDASYGRLPSISVWPCGPQPRVAGLVCQVKALGVRDVLPTFQLYCAVSQFVLLFISWVIYSECALYKSTG